MNPFEVSDLFASIEKEKRLERRKLEASKAIDTIVGALKITKTELSVAMRLHTPEVGKPGTSTISKWANGENLPGDSARKLLQLITQGIVRFRLVGKEGKRRRIFEPYLVECPRLVKAPGDKDLHPCGYAMTRRGGKEVCDTCLHEMPAVNDEDLVIDVDEMNLENALLWVAPETEITVGDGEITFERFQHGLKLELKEGHWRFTSTNRLGTRLWEGTKSQPALPRLEVKEGGELGEEE